MSKNFLNYISGKWVKSKNGTFENRNPADSREVLGVLPESGADDVEKAVLAAEGAYQEWRLMPPPKRGEIIMKAGLLLQEKKEEFARLMTREMGKVLKETRGDIQEAIDMALYVAGEGRRLLG